MSRVLIVDDGTENLYLLRTLLQGHGHDVDEASNGAEALAKANVRPPDLVISDLLMPVMDGYALLRHWRSHDELKSIPFIVYTATYTEPRDERLALDLGADAFLVKPAEPEILIAHVEEILAKRRSAAPTPDLEEPSLLKEHTEVLVRKLEKKVRELEEANRRLVQEAQERERAQEALRASEERLRQAQKMEAVGRLASGVAHDFNNLLTVVASHAEILLGMRDANETVRTSARSIAKASQRAAAVTRRLLGFGRHAAVKQEVVDLNQVVTDACELVTCSLGANIEIETNLAKETCRTSIDPAQLDQIIMNLAINARDAMPDGGRITIETSNVTLTGSEGIAVDPGEYFCIRVTDTGIGMEPAVIAKAFDPFFTTKPLGQGTGLGLSMTYGFVRQSGGDITIKSIPGEGTTICLYLPRYLGEVEEATTSMAGAHALSALEERTVLVVEDDEVVRRLILDVLAELRVRVLEARTGAAGLAILMSNQRIDLLISDVGLPELDGRQMVERARPHRPDLRTLFITGYADADPAIKDLGPRTQLMVKPFPMEVLVHRIGEMLAN